MKYKTIFLSDIHLGTEHCQYEKLLTFLKSLESADGSRYEIEKMYLNGDIIDLIQFNHKIFWSKHRKVIKKLLRMADKGVEIIYILGNHEYPLRDEFGQNFNIDFNGITFKERDVHVTADGKEYLIIHGDQFDGLVKTHPFIYKLGDVAYQLMNAINTLQNKIRRFFKMNEWSFALWIKTKTKEAVKFVANFELLIAEEAKKHNTYGIIAGHLHQDQDRMINDVRYLNCGTWVEFCSYIVEHHNGELEVKRYEY